MHMTHRLTWTLALAALGACGEAPKTACTTAALTCSAPGWQLEDVQPKSSRMGQTYGLEAFRDRATLVALLSAG